MMANLTTLCFPLFSSANLTSVSIRRLNHDGMVLDRAKDTTHVAMTQHCSLSTSHACDQCTVEMQ